MKIKLTRNTICGGKPVNAGATIEASERDAMMLIERKKAVPVKESKRETATTGAPETTDLPKK